MRNWSRSFSDALISMRTRKMMKKLDLPSSHIHGEGAVIIDKQGEVTGSNPYLD